MIEKNGFKAFGWADFMPYRIDTKDWDNLQSVKNEIPFDNVVNHFDTLKLCPAAIPNFIDAETGDRIECGKYYDGDFIFPAEFVYYFKKGVVGIPKEYEEYLKNAIRN